MNLKTACEYVTDQVYKMPEKSELTALDVASSEDNTCTIAYLEFDNGTMLSFSVDGGLSSEQAHDCLGLTACLALAFQ
jgi:hypothetical protein